MEDKVKSESTQKLLLVWPKKVRVGLLAALLVQTQNNTSSHQFLGPKSPMLGKGLFQNLGIIQFGVESNRKT